MLRNDLFIMFYFVNMNFFADILTNVTYIFDMNHSADVDLRSMLKVSN